MNTKKTLFLAVFVGLVIILAPIAKAEDGGNPRYFVHTTKSFWKNTLGVRNIFSDCFTSDLSGFQLKLAKIAGLELSPVKQLNILPEEVQTDSIISGKSRPNPGPRPTPSEAVPWGIKMVYNDYTLTNTSGGLGITVAVLDTGIANHPDLSNRVAGCKDFTNARQPVIDGKCDDKNGHGTHVAGIILADGGSDNLGIYGVAPEAYLFAYKVCSANGSCWSDDIAAAIYAATDNGANIINLSLGSDSLSSLIGDAISYAVQNGVLVVAAAGNDGPYIESIDYPGALVDVVAVGALNSSENIPDWSSRGGNTLTTPYEVEEKDIELAAPGVGILSTWKDGGYATLSGTSMASPHVAGLTAKFWSDHPASSSFDIRSLLHQAAHDLSPVGDDNASGFGLPTL